MTLTENWHRNWWLLFVFADTAQCIGVGLVHDNTTVNIFRAQLLEQMVATTGCQWLTQAGTTLPGSNIDPTLSSMWDFFHFYHKFSKTRIVLIPTISYKFCWFICSAVPRPCRVCIKRVLQKTKLVQNVTCVWFVEPKIPHDLLGWGTKGIFWPIIHSRLPW